MASDRDLKTLLKDKSGIRLDLGGGANPNPGFVNIDILDLPQVDIVWDLERTPWPLPDECALMVTASHVLEHLNPHGGDKRLQPLIDLLVRKKVMSKKEASDLGTPGPGLMNVMNEVWRVLKPHAQFAFVVPHGESPGFIQDPTHITPFNETTLHYFDPLSETALYQFYRPRPWEIVRQYFNPAGNLEVLLEKRQWDPSYLGVIPPSDITQEKM